MITLVEFLAPIRTAAPNRDRILAILYYQSRYVQTTSMTVEQIRKALKSSRIPKSAKVNVADVLAKSGHFVDTAGVSNGRTLWKLTSSGERHVRKLLKLPAAEPEIEHDVGSLATLTAKMTDSQTRDYTEEAVKCLQVGALRAAVVFLWSGAMRSIQMELLSKPLPQLNSSIGRFDPKARKVSKVEDFAYIKDAVVLLTAQDLGTFDKGEKDTLKEALDLRNRCGHPTKYRPGIKKVSSFIEDVIGVVFT